MLSRNMSLRMKLYSLEDLAFSGICYSSVNAVHFNVISKADKQACALQESFKKDGLSLRLITSQMLQECRIPLDNLNSAVIRIYDIGIS